MKKASLSLLLLGMMLTPCALAQSVEEVLRQNPNANITITGGGDVKVGGVPASLKGNNIRTLSSDTFSGTQTLPQEGTLFEPNSAKPSLPQKAPPPVALPPSIETPLFAQQPPLSLPKTSQTPTRMGPPLAPPQSLPPLPNMPSMNAPTIPIPVPNPQEMTVEATPQAGYHLPSFFAQLQEEGKRLQQALSGMNVTVLADDSDQYHQLLQRNQIKPQHFSPMEQELKWQYLAGTTLSTNQATTCFVILETEKAKSLHDNFVGSLEGISHPQTGYAYLVSHAVGHCLDESTRVRELNKKLQWQAQDATYVGLLPQAVMQVYGRAFSKDTYLSNPTAMNNHPLQQQYNERVADAFAVAWTMKLGGSKAFTRIVSLMRQKNGPQSPSFTSPSIELMASQEKEIQRLNRVDLLWDLSKLVQNKTMPSGQVQTQQQQSQQVEVARWIVSPQGLIPVDQYGRVIPQQNIKQDKSIPVQSLGPAGRNFDTLPRFGQ